MSKAETPMWRDFFPLGYRLRWWLKSMRAARTWLAGVSNYYDPARGIDYLTSATQGGRIPTLDECERNRRASPQYASVRLRHQADRLEQAFGRSEESIELRAAAELLEAYYEPCRHTAERFGNVTSALTQPKAAT